MSENVNNQYDFFKIVNLSADGAIGVNVISGGTGGGGGVTNTVVGTNGITNVGTNVNADLTPTYGTLANTVCEGNDVRLSGVRSVTGLNTDNTDPQNPIVQIRVDGSTITGAGTPADPLVSVGGTDTFVISGTYVDSTDTLALLRNDGNFVNVTGITDSFVTASTLNVTTLELARNNGLPTLTTDLSSLSTGGGVLTPTINSNTIKEVSVESDFGVVSGGIISLSANTTYIVRGQVNITNTLDVSLGNIIMGFNRDVDGLMYLGTGNMITVTDEDFTLRNLKLKSSTAAGKLLDATNITVASADNNGRTKILELDSLLVERASNVWTIRGFELVDVFNCLFRFIADGTIGCQFQSNRHLEITSCEFFNWYEEGNFSNLDLYRLIELLPNWTSGVGFGATNINGSIVHPHTIQTGLYVDSGSTTGFGVVASNTFTDTDLTTGVLKNMDYDLQNTFIVQSNQGIPNANAVSTMSLVGNLVYLENSVTNPITFNGGSTVGGGGFTTPITFPTSRRVITSEPNASLTYNTLIPSTFFVMVTATVQQSGNGVITMRLRGNGVPITSSIGTTQIRSGNSELLSFSVIGEAAFGDVFDVEVQSSTAANVLVSNFTLNGYQI